MSRMQGRAAKRRAFPGGVAKVLLAVAGAAPAVWLLCSLQRTALTVGLSWLAAGCLYLMASPRR